MSDPRETYSHHIKKRHHEKGWLYACVFTLCCCFCCYEACEGCLKMFCCCDSDDKDK
ncbi:hypothetical protein RND81_14G174600 [Saponaria officinalis]|uniref:Cysteine-rich transmembrane domain-containing protein n=1 Tax=Saponaria officinalis TaxID=3572 RepID=A0AAW1GP88_SAPOF